MSVSSSLRRVFTIALDVYHDITTEGIVLGFLVHQDNAAANIISQLNENATAEALLEAYGMNAAAFIAKHRGQPERDVGDYFDFDYYCNKMSQNTEQLFRSSRRKASIRNHSVLGTEHVLYMLVKSNGRGANWLKMYDINAKNVRKMIDEIGVFGKQSLTYKLESALKEAILGGRSHEVQSLIAKNVNLDFQYKTGETPMIFAAGTGNAELVNVLIEAKALVNGCGKKGDFPLMNAVACKKAQMVELLLKNNADVEKTDKMKRISLIEACTHAESKSIVNCLLEAKSDINDIQSGLSPLMTAAKHGCPKTVSTLLENGTEVLLQNNLGLTVFDYAVQATKSPLKIIRLLHKFFAYPEPRFISYSRLKNIKNIAEGNFGIVYRANLNIGESVDGPALIPVVCKVSKLTAGQNEWFELQTLQNIPPHRNLCCLTAMCTGFTVNDTKLTAMIMLYKEGGSLLDFLKSKSRKEALSFKKLVEFSREIAVAVGHLHENGYKHCDIAARNCLLSEVEDGFAENQSLALTDFGLARPLKFNDCTAKFPIKWCAPEVLESRGQITSAETDIWMIGVTIWEINIFPYILPFHYVTGYKMLMKAFDNGKHLIFTKNISQEFRSLILECCAVDPSKRPTAGELIDKISAITGTSHDLGVSNADPTDVIMGTEDRSVVLTGYSDIGSYVDIEPSETDQKIDASITEGMYSVAPKESDTDASNSTGDNVRTAYDDASLTEDNNYYSFLYPEAEENISLKKLVQEKEAEILSLKQTHV